MSWTRLVYGTAIIMALAGSAIYYSGPRAVIKPIDLVELHEAAYERLMPFGYTLVTNTLIYEQIKWSQDTSTNRWQFGTNQIPYLVFDGVETLTDRFININGISVQGTEMSVDLGMDLGGEWYFWYSGTTIPSYEDLAWSVGKWTISAVQTGRTILIEGGATNEYPAYVRDVHPRGIGVYNDKAILDRIDSMLIGVIPHYVDHEAAVDGVFTNAYLPMLTVSSVWTRLHLPYIWTNVSKTITNTYTNWVDSWTNAIGVVTNVDRIGTNSAWLCSTNITTNYTFTSSSICTTNMLNQRYAVAAYLRWTMAPWDGISWSHPSHSWTNAQKETFIEYSTNTTTISLSHSDGIILTNEYGPYLFPAWQPEWWVGDLTNPPPDEWKTPSECPRVIDDSTNGSRSVTNLVNSSPDRTFSTVGSYYKWQSWNWFWTPGEELFRFYSGTIDTFTNNLSDTVSHPAVKTPYNIAGVTVEGDVYGELLAIVGVSTVISNRILVASENMTTSNSLVWVCNPCSVNQITDIFPATNYPCSFTFSPDYWSIGSSWGVSWSQSAHCWIRDKDVVFKWSFSRCRP